MVDSTGKLYYICVVEYSGYPTERDKVGCDGLYIKSVESHLITEHKEELIGLLEKAGNDGKL